MTFRRGSTGALAALGLMIAGCGGAAEPDRLSLKTPTTPASAAPERTPVTDAERRVIRGWSDELRHGDVQAAAKYFSVPVQVLNVQPDALQLDSTRQVEDFNESLPCGAKLLGVQRTVDDLVVADFVLTDRPGGACGSVAGTRATFAFLINGDDHISRFILIDGKRPAPTPAPEDGGVSAA